jgi:antitoxin (DNA-binding transcriptional repressor) of toxin-antitoxin stability system
MHTVTIAEARKQLPGPIDEVRAGGEVVILAEDVPAARLVPIVRAGYGCLKGQMKMADDFDAPLDDFADYLP